jgi:hypothetical protein
MKRVTVHPVPFRTAPGSGHEHAARPHARAANKSSLTKSCCRVDDTRGGEFLRINDLLIRADYVKLLRDHGLVTLEALFGFAQGEALPSAGMGGMQERLRLGLEDRRGEVHMCHLSRYVSPPATVQRHQRWTCPEAQSTAGVEWCRLLALGDAGIPCATPVAFGEELENNQEARSAVIATSVPGQSLDFWITQWQAMHRGQIRRVFTPMARLLQRLHRRGFVHHSLSLGNIYYDLEAPLDRCVHVVNAQRVMQPQARQTRWIIKDLAALDFAIPPELMSTCDRVRFLKRYLGVRRLDPEHKRLIQRVAIKSRRLARHEMRPAPRPQLRSGDR